MNGSYGNNNNNNNFILHLRGLPWNATQAEVEDVLKDCKIRETNFTTDDDGRTTGECFVILESQEDLDLAKTFHQTSLGNRFIEVLDSNSEEMAQMIPNNNNSNPNSDSENNSSNLTNDNWHEPVVRLRGLPYNSSKEDVTRFFNGLDIAQNGVHISSSKPAGEAFVAFMNMDNALRALELNRMNMGHRMFLPPLIELKFLLIQLDQWTGCKTKFFHYIEVFKSTYAEARTSIMNDTQSMARQRGNNGGSNQNYGSQRQGNYGGYSGPPSNNYNSYGGSGGGSGNNFPTGSGVKRPMTVSFTMKIRGVPFEAGEKEVFEFFNPVVPIRLEQENTPRGKPPIWYAEFGSREEATEALTYHKKYMGTRYIELLPLYDDLNRSKMVRT